MVDRDAPRLLVQSNSLLGHDYRIDSTGYPLGVREIEP